ncbi:Shedu anti-phage system protein SduA domain-containing protein [Couchioplanes azureus]|nr:Shedu anti-phage system protein SduA domain-containing protein [Couchioplanes caeruleus]
MRVFIDLGDLNAVTTEQLQGWLDRKNAVETRRTYFGHLRRYYSWALSVGKLTKDPTEGVTLPPSRRNRRQPARFKDYQRVMREADGRWRIVATLALFAGLGPMNIAELLREDIDDQSIHVRSDRRDANLVSTHPEVWRHVRNLGAGYIISNSRGEPYTPDSLSHAFSTHMKSLGIDGLTLQGLMNLYKNVVQFDEDIAELLASPGGAGTAYRQNPEAFRIAIENDVTADDIIALAKRRKQLERFQRLLDDAEFFESEREPKGGVGPERVWQDFLQENPWILGVSLGGQLLTSWSDEKLEQTVSGFSIDGPGKRVDALLRTSGRIRSLVFAEIKHHQTSLLQKIEYRPGCWAPSVDLAGGVTQIQQTVHKACDDIGTYLAEKKSGYFTGEFTALVRPRSYLILGSLESLCSAEGKMHQPKHQCFELYRRNVYEPEIVTFDELLARARWHVFENEASLSTE